MKMLSAIGYSLLLLLGIYSLSMRAQANDFNPVNTKNAQGQKVGLWIDSQGDCIKEVSFYVNDFKEGPSFHFGDSGKIDSVFIYSMGIKSAVSMEHVYPIEGKPFFYSEGYSGLRFWLNGYWNIRDGYLHGIHWNTRDERSYKKGKSYYVYYKGNCVYMWFDDKKGNHLNGYNLYEKRTSYSLDSAFLKGKNLTMSFSNLTTTPIRVPNLYGRTIEYNLKDLNPEHYWQSNDTLYVSISDSSNRNEFIWETKVGGYKQRYKPYQFTIADRMIENVLLPNENVSYRLKIDLKEPPHFLAFQYVNRIDCLRISIIE